jgi:hypothetical protein
MNDDKVAFGLLVNNQPSPLRPPKARYTGVDAGRRAKHYGVAQRRLAPGLWEPDGSTMR